MLRKFTLAASSILFVFLVGMKLLSYSLPLNVLSVMVNKTLNQDDVDARKRQATIRQVVTLLQPYQGNIGDDSDSYTMIPSIIQGLSHYRNGELDTAISWFKASTEVNPYPETQKHISLPPFLQIDNEGSLMLNGNSERWQVRSDSGVETKIQRHLEKAATFSCDPDANPPRGNFVLANSLNLPYHHKVIIKANSEIGTTFIFETVTDGEITRHITSSGTGATEQFEIVLQNEQIDFIFLAVAANQETNSGSTCQTELESIKFVLDKDIR